MEKKPEIMKHSVVLSLAFLKVSWDIYGRDYLENFIPFVAECLRFASSDVVAIPELQKDL